MLLSHLFVLTDSISAGAFSVLTLGFVLGLKHALDADHLVAVSAIVSERKGFLSASVVGVLWGLGHTVALLAVGFLVLALRVQIPESIAVWMEFAVAVMIVGLGVNVLWKVFRGGRVHTHVHTHDGHLHAHPHLHSPGEAHEHPDEHSPSHHKLPLSWVDGLLHHARSGKKSILIGMIHGMAGSAALMLVVLASIASTAVGIMYIAVFGLGSILGMLIMSTLISLPFVASAHRSERMNIVVRSIAGIVSVVFGLFLAWEIGGGLFL